MELVRALSGKILEISHRRNKSDTAGMKQCGVKCGTFRAVTRSVSKATSTYIYF